VSSNVVIQIYLCLIRIKPLDSVGHGQDTACQTRILLDFRGGKLEKKTRITCVGLQ
jgi:hypothetical protein